MNRQISTYQNVDAEMAMRDIIGPYSIWPKKRRSNRRHYAIASLSVAGAAVFVHCILPMMA